MDIVKDRRERKHLNSLEKYRIYLISKDSLNMNETHIDSTQYLRPYMDSTPDSSIYPPLICNRSNHIEGL
jgi:hypothetical protein